MAKTNTKVGTLKSLSQQFDTYTHHVQLSNQGFWVWLGCVWLETVMTNTNTSTQRLQQETDALKIELEPLPVMQRCMESCECAWLNLPQTTKRLFQNFEKSQVLEVQTEADKSSREKARVAFGNWGTLQVMPVNWLPKVVVIYIAGGGYFGLSRLR